MRTDPSYGRGGFLRARLAQLGLVPEALIQALDRALRDASSCTLYDPPITAGFLMWARTVRYLREALLPMGWEKNDDRNYCTVFNSRTDTAIAVAAGDANTGLHTPIAPSTRTVKGPLTRKAIDVNQLALPGISDHESDHRAAVQTWILLHHYDHETEMITAELSLPIEIAGDGHVDQWRERLLLPPIDFGGTSSGDFRPDDDDGGSESEIDIPIQPR